VGEWRGRGLQRGPVSLEKFCLSYFQTCSFLQMGAAVLQQPVITIDQDW